MTNSEGFITEDITNTIAPGQKVYEREGKQVGGVDMVDRDTGYFTVAPDPFSDRERPFPKKRFHVPFRLITNIDPRELFVAVSREELQRDYARPPGRSTQVVHADGEEIAITTGPSGYTGAPMVVQRVRIDQLRQRIAEGDHVYTSELTDLGTIKEYDASTGLMRIEQDVLSSNHELLVPVMVVADVNRDTNEVYLVCSQADVEQMQHGEPIDVVTVDITV